jgi:hypothetical protein
MVQAHRAGVARRDQPAARHRHAAAFGLFMDRLVGPDFEGGLKNLKVLVEG